MEYDQVISEKVLHFVGKNKDLNQLSQEIVKQLSAEGYKTQSKTVPLGNSYTGTEGGGSAGYHHCGQSVHHPHSWAAQ